VLNGVLQALIERKLVIALTPPGRGQLFSHNLYLPEELQALRNKIVASGGSESHEEPSEAEASAASSGSAAVARPSGYAAVHPPASAEGQAELAHSHSELAELRTEVRELRETLAQLEKRLRDLEQLVNT
jgi:hypothetical protein